ncbi:calmodulin-like [Teleopsis dalmanni]|uniref:calmodulin-like n=1 Tax=Teleopsis dalmanni TaxID=139649 RepID=UPI0018CD5AFD|nr:calmodulin-like [Teleopsis dalmanni]
MSEPLSEEKINEYRKAFTRFDKDGDGSITIKELNSVMNCLGIYPSNSQFSEIVHEARLVNIDKIEFSDFLSIIIEGRMLKESETDSKVHQAFTLFDRDDDGYISLTDLRSVMPKLITNITEEEIDEMFYEADLDDDGKVDFEEFVVMLNSCVDKEEDSV